MSVLLRTPDGFEMEIPQEVVDKLPTIRDSLADFDSEESAIDLPTLKYVSYTGDGEEIENYRPSVDSESLETIVDHVTFYLSKHDAAEIKKYNDKYYKMTDSQLFRLITACNYLNYEDLLNICCKVVASFLTGKSAQQIRDRFHIPNDLTPEMEQEIRSQNSMLMDPKNIEEEE